MKLANEARNEGLVGKEPVDIFGKKSVEQNESNVVTLEEAEKIFEKDFLGPKAVEKVFGISLAENAIPPIPFSRKELENAKALGQQLIFQAREMKIKESGMSKLWEKEYYCAGI